MQVRLVEEPIVAGEFEIESCTDVTKLMGTEEKQVLKPLHLTKVGGKHYQYVYSPVLTNLVHICGCTLYNSTVAMFVIVIV